MMLAALDEAQRRARGSTRPVASSGFLPARLSAGEASLAGTTDGAARGAGHAMRSPRPRKRISSQS